MRVLTTPRAYDCARLLLPPPHTHTHTFLPHAPHTHTAGLLRSAAAGAGPGLEGAGEPSHPGRPDRGTRGGVGGEQGHLAAQRARAGAGGCGVGRRRGMRLVERHDHLLPDAPRQLWRSVPDRKGLERRVHALSMAKTATHPSATGTCSPPRRCWSRSTLASRASSGPSSRPA